MTTQHSRASSIPKSSDNTNVVENAETKKHAEDEEDKILLIGAGTIGLSFAALHLRFLKDASNLTLHDTRPDLQNYVLTNLPKLLPGSLHASIPHVHLSTTPTTLTTAVSQASIIQEQGPENLPFKTALWALIAPHVPPTALLWSSTSGIPASAQAAALPPVVRAQLLVVHPYNPAHLMPLLEVVPSPATSAASVARTCAFWAARGRAPVVLRRETPGFVANRLAFALLREAVRLVRDGVVSVAECDDIVTASMGPRWAVWGPFRSYHAGGGEGGIEAFFSKIGGSVQACWEEGGTVNFGKGEGWEQEVFRQCEETFGKVDLAERDRKTIKVLEAVRD